MRGGTGVRTGGGTRAGADAPRKVWRRFGPPDGPFHRHTWSWRRFGPRGGPIPRHTFSRRRANRKSHSLAKVGRRGARTGKRKRTVRQLGMDTGARQRQRARSLRRRGRQASAGSATHQQKLALLTGSWVGFSSATLTVALKSSWNEQREAKCGTGRPRVRPAGNSLANSLPSCPPKRGTLPPSRHERHERQVSCLWVGVRRRLQRRTRRYAAPNAR